jgi:CheY-like chemotaxis protein
MRTADDVNNNVNTPVRLWRWLAPWSKSPAARQAQDLAPRVAVSAAGNGKRVLIVDDDPVVRLALSGVLRNAGYEIATAADCSEAIGAVGQGCPDVILVDLNFAPDVAFGGGVSWDGLGLMRWLQGLKNAKTARFIVITSSDSEDCRQRVAKAGAAGFFRKPIDHHRLLETIRGQLDGEPGRLTKLFERELPR